MKDPTPSANIKHARAVRGLSQAALADRSGLSKRAIGHFETGKYLPGIMSCMWLSEVLGVRPGDLAFDGIADFRLHIQRGTKAVDDLALVPNPGAFAEAFVIIDGVPTKVGRQT